MKKLDLPIDKHFLGYHGNNSCCDHRPYITVDKASVMSPVGKEVWSEWSSCRRAVM